MQDSPNLGALVAKELDEMPCRSLTRRLIIGLLIGDHLPPPVLIDFGIDSDEHRYALREVLDSLIDEVGLNEASRRLDAALGHGKILTELARAYAPGLPHITFQTSWDVIRGDDSEAG